MSTIETGVIVEILPTRIWIEDDLFGTHYVMVQHEGEDKPFEYCALHYSWLYTSNGHIDAVAEHIARYIGAQGVIEHRFRESPEWLDGIAAWKACEAEYASWTAQEPGRNGAPKESSPRREG